MKILVCGGRDFADKGLMESVMSTMSPSIVIHGDAPGADRLADEWATAQGIPVARVPALWQYYRQSAGPIRNKAMLLLEPDLVVAFPGGRGTANMVMIAQQAGIPVRSI